MIYIGMTSQSRIHDRIVMIFFRFQMIAVAANLMTMIIHTQFAKHLCSITSE